MRPEPDYGRFMRSWQGSTHSAPEKLDVFVYDLTHLRISVFHAIEERELAAGSIGVLTEAISAEVDAVFPIIGKETRTDFESDQTAGPGEVVELGESFFIALEW